MTLVNCQMWRVRDTKRCTVLRTSSAKPRRAQKWPSPITPTVYNSVDDGVVEGGKVTKEYTFNQRYSMRHRTYCMGHKVLYIFSHLNISSILVTWHCSNINISFDSLTLMKCFDSIYTPIMIPLHSFLLTKYLVNGSIGGQSTVKDGELPFQSLWDVITASSWMDHSC